MFIVGIDIAKRSHEAIILDGQGKVIQKAFNFPNTFEGYQQLTAKLHRITNIKSDLVFAMEATSHYWLPLYSRLSDEGYLVHVINPRQTHALRELYLRQHKTDAKDAFVIAEVVRFGRFSDAQVPPDHLLALRELSRNRTSVVSMAADLKRKVIALIDQVFPEYESVFSSIFVESSVAVLMKYPTPEKLNRANLTGLTNVLLKASNGRFGKGKAMQIKSLAARSFGLADKSGAYAMLISSYLAQIQFLQGQAEEIEAKIKELMGEIDSAITSIPGIGPVLGAVILAELGDVSRFSSADKLSAFAGMDPSVKQSGESTAASHMSKRGSPYLRRAIWLATTVAVMHDPMFKAYFEKKTAAGKNYSCAMGHTTKKMISVIYAVLRDNTPYQPVLHEAA